MREGLSSLTPGHVFTVLQYTSNQPDQDFLEGALCFAKVCEDFVPTQTLLVLIIINMTSNAITPTI